MIDLVGRLRYLDCFSCSTWYIQDFNRIQNTGNSSSTKFHILFLALSHHLSIIDSFRWFWIGPLGESILLMHVSQVPFLVLHLFYCILMTPPWKSPPPPPGKKLKIHNVLHKKINWPFNCSTSCGSLFGMSYWWSLYLSWSLRKCDLFLISSVV